MYPNTTQVSNIILDNQNLFTDGELRVALAITRKTIGWHKETDFIRYSQLMGITGKSKPTISEAVNGLLQKGIIKRVDIDGRELKKMPQGFRGEVFYTLHKELVKNINQLNSLTSTGKKSLPYKTNSNKTKYIGKAQNIKNVDNFVDKPLVDRNTQVKPLTGPSQSTSKKSGIKSVGDIISARPIEGQLSLMDSDVKKNIRTSHQAYAGMVIKNLDLLENGTDQVTGDISSRNYYNYFPRLAKALKNKPLYDIEAATRKTLKKNIMDADGRFKFFITCLNNPDGSAKRGSMPALQRNRMVSI